MIDPDLQRYYEEVLALFKSRGWGYIVEDLTKLRDGYNKVENCHNLDFSKGQVDILNHVIALPSIFERAFKELEEEAEREDLA
jgi:hypothetical protein